MVIFFKEKLYCNLLAIHWKKRFRFWKRFVDRVSHITCQIRPYR